MELSFDKYCFVDSSPTTVLPAPQQHLKVSDTKKSSGKPRHRNHIPVIDDHSVDIKLIQHSNAPCRAAGLPQKTEAVVGREKIDFSGGTDQSAFGIINSLCTLDEDSSLVERKKESVMSHCDPSKSQNELYTQDFMTSFESVAATANDANGHLERDPEANLFNLLSLLSTCSDSPINSDSDGSSFSSPKSRFGSVRKMLTPFVKSKSHRSPSSGSNESDRAMRHLGLPGIHHNKSNFTQLLTDVSDKPRDLVLPNSAALLHGFLKLQTKHGVPFFEFSVKSTEDIYVGKTWKADNALTWAYSFHSLCHGRKTNASRWGFNGSHRESSMVGKMHVSCHICSEFNCDGELNDSLAMEFVLIDIIHSRKSTTPQDNANHAPDVGQAPRNFNKIISRSDGHLESTGSLPPELHSELEIGAAVMQVPLEKQGGLTMIKGTPPNLMEQCKAMEGIYVTSHSPKIQVVIPAGNHTLPTSKSRGPSPLLDRLKLGGGCDCGGWDMACPLVVFSNRNVLTKDCHPLIDSRNLAELFVQGKKESTPAFAMTAIEDGKYAVNFHAQLSSLQAFFICIAILHTTETSTTLVNKWTSLSDSLRLFSEDKVRNTTDASKSEVNKKMEEVLPSFVLNPPFSPVARV